MHSEETTGSKFCRYVEVCKRDCYKGVFKKIRGQKTGYSWPLSNQMKKRHAIINQEINTETNQMKDWTSKRKIDFIIGVVLQIYLLFPWIQHYTIYGYLYNVLKMNDYVQMYNETILPSLRESWNYTKMTAFVFLVIIILIALFQLTELARIYHILKNEQSSDYRGFFGLYI